MIKDLAAVSKAHMARMCGQMTLCNIAVVAAGALGASGVACGAFGAHALKGALDGPHMLLWQTASLYHLLHALALAAAASRLTPGQGGPWPGVCVAGFGAGVLLFSGSLYALALGAPRAWGVVTPVGGLCLMAGWLALAAVGLNATR